MKRKHFAAGFYIFILLITMLINALFGLRQAFAEELPVIFSNEQLVIKGGSTQTADQIDWQVDYQKQTGKIAFQFTDENNQPIVPQSMPNFQTDHDGWLSEKIENNNDRIQFTTPTTTKEIRISVKLYPNASDETTLLFQTTDPIILSGNSSIERIAQEQSTQPKKETSSTQTIAQDANAQSSMNSREVATIPPQSGESTEKSTTISSEKPKARLAAIPAAQVLAVPLSGAVSPADPFSYTTNSTGTFLTNSTNSYSNTLTSNNIRNYAFNQSRTEGSSTVKNSFSSGGLTFDNGYHDYDDALLKKTIAPTSDPNQFDIQLDLIGKALTKRQKVDVVFVIDKSASMNNSLDQGTRWTNAQTALRKFADDLLNTSDDTIRLALTSFGSSNEIPFADIAKFGTNTFFTNNPTTFKNNSLITELPSNGNTSGSGTPTYLGLDAGYALATNTQFGSRSDAAKVVITLTDGLPTFAPNTNYTNLTNRVLDLSVDNSSSSKTRYSAQKNNINYYSGDGNNAEDTATISYVNTRNNLSLFQNIKKYSIGYITGTNNVLTTLGKDGAYTANNGSQLITVLTNLSTALTATIQNAVLTDPLSTYVEAVGVPTVKALSLGATSLTVISDTDANYPNYAKQFQRAFSTNQLQLSNINLGANNSLREGLRVNYRIQIKEAYRDGLFYPTNGTTLLNNQVNSTASYYHFAVPSARVPAKTIDLQVKKTWDDSQNKWNLRKAITLQLQQKNNNAWVNVDGQVKTLPANTTNWNTSFTGISQYQNGVPIEYRVIETSEGKDFVSGYEKPTYSPTSTTNGAALEVTNKLKTTLITLKKVQSDGVTPLANAKFGVYLKEQPQTLIQDMTSTSDGSVGLPALPIGSYILKELSAPSGYTTMTDLTFTISQNAQGDLAVQGLPTENKLVNQLKDFQFSLTKTSTTGTKLSGAVFELAKNGTVLETVTSASDGTVTFTQGLNPGQYTLKETQTPIGYSAVTNQWTITIDQNQTVTIKNQAQETIYNQKAVFDTVKNRWLIKDFTLTNQLNDFTLKVLKKDQAGNALAGAAFKLTGPNQYEKELSGNQSTFDFTGLKPGTYTLSETKTPDGYQTLQAPVTIAIDAQGKVTIDQKDIPAVLSRDGNVIQLSITNQVIMPLPKTGGIGLIPFILIGAFLSLAFGALLIKRRGGGKNEN